MIFVADLNSHLENVIQLIVVLFVFLIVVVLTGITTKWVGGLQKTQYSNKNMKPIESMKVGNNKYIQLIQVGEVYLILGIGKDEVHTIAKLTKDELPELMNQDVEDGAASTSSFSNILNKLCNKDSRKIDEDK